MKHKTGHKISRIVRNMASIYSKQHVTVSAASLSYFITLTVFPMLICASAILGSLNISQASFLAGLEEIIPGQALALLADFLGYVGVNPSPLMVVFGVVVTITSSSAAFRSILRIMGDIQGVSRFGGILNMVVSFVMSVAFLLAIYISALVIISGEWLLQILETHLGFGHIFGIWSWFRFVILFILLFFVIYSAYFISAPKETKRTHRLPGALLASVLLVIVSIFFSKMVSESLKYAIVYGSLASFIIMMVWLYACGIILIMGNVFNISLQSVRDGRELPEEEG